MIESIVEFIGIIAEFILDIIFWRKVKKRRKFEKENNLPKSIVWHPIAKPLLYFFLILTPISFIFFFFLNPFNSEKKTKDKMNQIVILLEAEKKQFNRYPVNLEDIIRNNPLRQKLTIDSWNNNFIYKISKDSLNYTLISFGSDEKENTTDDLIFKNLQ